jgi:YggT family protein
MTVLRVVLIYLLTIYLLLLIGRLIISWIQSFSRSWSPGKGVAVVAEVLFSATDPPLRLLRRFIPSLRIGNVALDLSFMLLFLVVFVLLQVASRI